MSGERKPPMIQVCLLKRRRRGVKIDLKFGGQWNVPSLVANGMWKKNTFSPLPTFLPTTYLNLQFFDLEVLLYHGFRSLFTPFLRFPWSINYDYAFRCNKSFTPSLSIWFWFWFDFFPLLEIMVSRMVTSYGPQITQTNEEPPPELSLDVTLIQHPCDEEPEPQEVHVHFEVESLRTWYYFISLNFRTLVILLQIDPTSGDELEIVCEACYKTEDTSIFTWFLVPDIGQYRWWRAPKPLGRLKLSLSMETSERWGVRGMLPSSQHFKGVEGHAGALGWD